MQYIDKIILTIMVVILFMLLLDKPFRSSFSKELYDAYATAGALLVLIGLPFSILLGVWMD
jgi:hypothetical protein